MNSSLTKINKMRLEKLLLFLSFVLFIATTSAQNAKLTAEAPRAVIAGEKFQLVYTANAEGSDFRLPAIDGFQVLMGPSTSQKTYMSITNGNAERSYEFTFIYILKADQPGKYQIPLATFIMNGKKVESNSIQIEVIKGDESSASNNTTQAASRDDEATGISNEDLFITTSTNKRDVYKDEPIVLTTKIYVRPTVNLQNISDLKNPELKDFLSQDLPKKQNLEWGIETLNGKTYNVAVFDQKLIFPQRTGVLSITPVEMEFIIKERTARRSQSVFEDFFESNYRNVKKRVISKLISLTVKNLPGDAPSDFNGLVGDFTMKMNLTKTSVKTNDGITLTISVPGTGNHKLMNAPVINTPSDFDKFDPKVTNNIDNTIAGMTGTKIFEYLIIPRHSGTFTIPSVSFSYFDIKTKQYKTLRTEPTTIQVEKGNMEETATAIPQYASSREDLKYIGKDIRHINTDQLKLYPKSNYLFGSLLFYLLFIIPLALFFVFVVFAQKHISENANIQLVKNKRANKMAIKRLNHAAIFLKQNKKEEFYNETLRALWGYLGDKLSLPVSNLSKDNAQELLNKRNINAETIQAFMENINECEFARYSPNAGTDAMDELYKKSVDTLVSIEGQIRKK